VGTCGTSFQLFWGEVPNEKKYWKPVPPCFWHVAKIFFLMGKIFWDFTCDRKIFCQKWKYFSPPKKKSRKNFTCDRHLNLSYLSTIRNLFNSKPTTSVEIAVELNCCGCSAVEMFSTASTQNFDCGLLSDDLASKVASTFVAHWDWRFEPFCFVAG